MKKISKPKDRSLKNKIIDALATYIRIQFILVVVVAALAWAVLHIIGVEYAWILALITGAVTVVPFWGTFASAILAALVAIFDGIRFLPTLPVVFEGFAILGVYVLLNALVDFFLGPYLNAKLINIPPLMLLFLIVIATSAFGLIGALLTVPALLIVKTILEHRDTPS